MEKVIHSKKFIFSVLGAAALLIALGAGCAPTATPARPQPAVQVQTEDGTPVQVQVLPNPEPSAEPPSAAPPVAAPTPAPSAEPPAKGATSYKDGTYKAQGDYFTHAGPESVTVTLTLKDDIVIDSQFQSTPNAMMSGRYMQMFSDNYKPVVIGKDISDLQLGRVSGSSLTPMGFNDAVAKIKAQAKA